MNILIIEDNEKHIVGALCTLYTEYGDEKVEIYQTNDEHDIDFAIKRKKDEEKLNIFIAKDYRTARKLIDSEIINTVVSDIFFPLDKGKFTDPEALGIGIAIQCEKKGIPFVINSSGWNHGKKFQWVHDICSENDWKMIFNTNQINPELECEIKDWKNAFELLIPQPA